MTPAENLNKTLKEIAGKNVPIQTFWATVDTVDWVNKTAVVKDLSAELEVYDVLLGLGGDMVKPKIKSNCLCGVIENKEAAVFVLYAEEVEERWINGDANGGLAIVPELKKQLDKMTARVDGIMDAIKNAIPIAQDGGVGLQTSMKVALALIVDKESFKEIESKKVKHG